MSFGGFGASSGGGGSSFPSLSSLKIPSFGGSSGSGSSGSSASPWSFGTGSSSGSGSSSSGSGSSPSSSLWNFGTGGSSGSGSSSSAFPSLSSFFPGATTKQPGGITGGQGQAPTWNLPSLSSFPTFPGLGSGGGASAANSGDGSAAGGGNPLSQPFSQYFSPTSPASSMMNMPGGFSSALFGQSAAVGGSGTSPAALTQRNSNATGGGQVTQGNLTYTPLANSNTKTASSPPQLSQTAANPAPGSVSTARDQYGREFNYASSADDPSTGSVVGVSANGTVLKKTSAGQVYDTGATATAPRAAAATPQKVAVAPPPRVATPTSVPVKQSQPTVSSGPTPEEIEKQRRDSGYYLQ